MIITSTMPKRGTDPKGSGEFGASRGDRKHRGIDYAVAAESIVNSPVSGVISKLGTAYSDDPTYRYIEIQDAAKCFHRLFYVAPWVTKGHIVSIGDPVGEAQDIAARYPGMKNHVHYSIRKPDGVIGKFEDYINPEEY